MSEGAAAPSEIVYVVNASSRKDTGITDELARTLDWANRIDGVEVLCVTLEDGPNGISTARDSDDAAPAVLRFVEREGQRAEVAGFVIACFSDPGVFAAKSIVAKPVIGIGEAGFLASLALGERVGTIALSSNGENKMRRFARAIGVGDRLAGHIDAALDYGQLKDEACVRKKLVEAALKLRDIHKADVILLAGAGMGGYAATLHEAVRLPVIDPTQAAVSTMLGYLRGLAVGIQPG